ncbi:MAG: hypothetical protein U1E05_12155 [Patescibacteria group bacterium]|nr:hypothetical protein [Patescibacteria group bacterium]
MMDIVILAPRDATHHNMTLPQRVYDLRTPIVGYTPGKPKET